MFQLHFPVDMKILSSCINSHVFPVTQNDVRHLEAAGVCFYFPLNIEHGNTWLDLLETWPCFICEQHPVLCRKHCRQREGRTGILGRRLLEFHTDIWVVKKTLTQDSSRSQVRPACDPRTWEANRRGQQIQGQPELWVLDNVSYTARSCLKNKTIERMDLMRLNAARFVL